MSTVVDILIKCVFPIIGVIVSYYIIPLLRDKAVYQAIVVAVEAAEQIFNQSGMGEKKYEYVATYITSHFKFVKFTDEELKRLIEAVVYEKTQVVERLK